MESKTKKYLAASSVIIGTCIGAGILGIPYVTAQSGFFVSLFYLVLLGGIVMLINLYLGETALRTKQDHQLAGYAKKYLGKKAGALMNFAFIFEIYAALVAYMWGIGQSISFLAFGNLSYALLFGIIFGVFISFLLWNGTKYLKKYELGGVLIVLILILSIFIFFVGRVDVNNVMTFNFSNLLVPFGVIMFSLFSFQAIPEAALILKKDKSLLKKSIISSSIVSVILYILFTFVVVGFEGARTPEIATFSLGFVFVILGIFTMFTSHLSSGNALVEGFEFDERFKKLKSWSLTSFLPLIIYVLIYLSGFFSFTKILSIGGSVSGVIVVILSLFVVKNAKKNGERKPEYSIPLNWYIIMGIILIFVLGASREFLGIFLH